MVKAERFAAGTSTGRFPLLLAAGKGDRTRALPAECATAHVFAGVCPRRHTKLTATIQVGVRVKHVHVLKRSLLIHTPSVFTRGPGL